MSNYLFYNLGECALQYSSPHTHSSVHSFFGNFREQSSCFPWLSLTSVPVGNVPLLICKTQGMSRYLMVPRGDSHCVICIFIWGRRDTTCVNNLDFGSETGGFRSDLDSLLPFKSARHLLGWQKRKHFWINQYSKTKKLDLNLHHAAFCQVSRFFLCFVYICLKLHEEHEEKGTTQTFKFVIRRFLPNLFHAALRSITLNTISVLLLSGRHIEDLFLTSRNKIRYGRWPEGPIVNKSESECSVIRSDPSTDE